MTSPTRLVFQCDFSADPVWLRRDDGKGSMMVPLENLPLSAHLVGQLREWASLHDRLNDPPFWWAPEAEMKAHQRQGRVLLAALQKELGPSYDVTGRQ